MEDKLRKILKEMKEVIEVLEEEAENRHSVKFFLGKLNLLMKTLVDLYWEYN